MGPHHHDCDYKFGVRAPSLPAGTVSLPHSGMLMPCGVNTSTENVNVRTSPGMQRANADELAPDLFTAVVPDRHVTAYSHASPTFG